LVPHARAAIKSPHAAPRTKYLCTKGLVTVSNIEDGPAKFKNRA
jgi:hypothetical protein